VAEGLWSPRVRALAAAAASFGAAGKRPARDPSTGRPIAPGMGTRRPLADGDQPGRHPRLPNHHDHDRRPAAVGDGDQPGRHLRLPNRHDHDRRRCSEGTSGAHLEDDGSPIQRSRHDAVRRRPTPRCPDVDRHRRPLGRRRTTGTTRGACTSGRANSNTRRPRPLALRARGRATPVAFGDGEVREDFDRRKNPRSTAAPLAGGEQPRRHTELPLRPAQTPTRGDHDPSRSALGDVPPPSPLATGRCARTSTDARTRDLPPPLGRRRTTGMTRGASTSARANSNTRRPRPLALRARGRATPVAFGDGEMREDSTDARTRDLPPPLGRRVAHP